MGGLLGDYTGLQLGGRAGLTGRGVLRGFALGGFVGGLALAFAVGVARVSAGGRVWGGRGVMSFRVLTGELTATVRTLFVLIRTRFGVSTPGGAGGRGYAGGDAGWGSCTSRSDTRLHAHRTAAKAWSKSCRARVAASGSFSRAGFGIAMCGLLHAASTAASEASYRRKCNANVHVQCDSASNIGCAAACVCNQFGAKSAHRGGIAVVFGQAALRRLVRRVTRVPGAAIARVHGDGK